MLVTRRCAPALRLAMLFAAAAALRQAAAVKVANADEFVAAIRSNDEVIEVTEHLYLNDGEAVALADAIENEGYLFNIVGTQRTITVRRPCCRAPVAHLEAMQLRARSAGLDNARMHVTCERAHLLRRSKDCSASFTGWCACTE